MKRKIVLSIIVAVIILSIVVSYFIINSNRRNINTVVSTLDNNTTKTDTGTDVNTEKYVVEHDYDKYKEVPIDYSYASYAYDTSTPEKAIGFADYVFVAKVNNILRTEYKYPTETVIDGKIKTVYVPYTIYSITVIENIKGEIIKNKDIEIMQYGGLNEDTKSYNFLERYGTFECRGILYFVSLYQ